MVALKAPSVATKTNPVPGVHGKVPEPQVRVASGAPAAVAGCRKPSAATTLVRPSPKLPDTLMLVGSTASPISPFVGFGLTAVPDAAGPVLSKVRVRVAGCPDVTFAASVAVTETVWVPSERPVTVAQGMTAVPATTGAAVKAGKATAAPPSME